MYNVICEQEIKGCKDKLTLVHTNGYAPDPSKKIWSVGYNEWKSHKNYDVCNSEYFETLEMAIKAFDVRFKSDNPFKPSGLPTYQW